jgi:hypothetical protein
MRFASASVIIPLVVSSAADVAIAQGSPAIDPDIAAQCAEKWPNDLDTFVYCVREQSASKDRSDRFPSDNIRSTRDVPHEKQWRWPKLVTYRMRMDCAEFFYKNGKLFCGR